MSKIRTKILDTLQEITDLPTLPVVMTKLNVALNNIDCSAKDIENILKNDPVLSAKLLKTVNSPLFSASKTAIVDVKHAVARLGFSEVKNIVLSSSVFKMFSKVKSTLFNKEDFWTHCIYTSFAAVEIANILNKKDVKKSEIHLAALLHDIGKIILDAYFSDFFEQALLVCLNLKIPLYEAENIYMNINHSELGSIIAEKWNLPPLAINSIKYHHTPYEAPDEYIPTIQVVHLANYLVNTQDLGTSGELVNPVFQRTVLDDLGINAGDLMEIVHILVKGEEEISSILI